MRATRRILLATLSLCSLTAPATWAKSLYYGVHRVVRPPAAHQPAHPQPPTPPPNKPAPPPTPPAALQVQRPIISYIPPAPKVDPEKLEAEKKRIESNTVTWLKQRVDEGSSSAQYAMGIRYLNGDGV